MSLFPPSPLPCHQLDGNLEGGLNFLGAGEGAGKSQEGEQGARPLASGWK